MATTMRLLPVRTTARVRAMIDRVGTVNAATRALLFIGAHRAGLELSGMDREIALLLAEDLDRRVSSALRQVYVAVTDTLDTGDPDWLVLLPTDQPEPVQALTVGNLAPSPTQADATDTLPLLPFEQPAPSEADDDPFGSVGIDV